MKIVNISKTDKDNKIAIPEDIRHELRLGYNTSLSVAFDKEINKLTITAGHPVKLEVGGKLALPEDMVKDFGIEPGSVVLISANKLTDEMTIAPLSKANARLIGMRILLKDVPGALTEISNIFGSQEINMIAAKARVLKPGKVAKMKVILDMSSTKHSTQELMAMVKSNSHVRDAYFFSISDTAQILSII